jgi:hypothetical protein
MADTKTKLGERKSEERGQISGAVKIQEVGASMHSRQAGLFPNRSHVGSVRCVVREGALVCDV